MAEHEPVELDAAAIAARAARDAGAESAVFLDGYIEMLVAVSATGRRLTGEELGTRRVLGAAAAEQNCSLRALVDLYLSANWLTWRELPSAAGADEGAVRAVAESVMRAADDAIVALAEGYEEAQRLVVRQEEARRREFIDDLLHGRSDLGRLAETAERFGLQLAGRLAVAVAGGDRGFVDGDALTRRVESDMLARFRSRDVLITAKDGLLVCIASGTADDVLAEFARQVELALAADARWCVGLGRPHAGPGGAVRSYEEARGTLELAEALGLNARVLHATDLLVFQVLLRDRVAITDLVTTVLGPLEQARGGAEPLLDTLTEYFASGGVTAAAARRLHLSVRAVTYRLDRIKRLTGQDVDDPTQRFTLEAAVLGARLLDWPRQALPTFD
ncbi:PucR family transcriptional regulator [Actinomadura sp. KC06]|uniref:PucR family transcriptional regulator n=1 Tax=Actinomadura sp. KC06 TaxID=2530369 RepID=UPI00104B29C7|nr:helix-turn-helix domain-containing protein [Actinomadura sp. KC06]TDD35269.1 PucR family transcriptional regulator [Actinomadura sp. KC06]